MSSDCDANPTAIVSLCTMALLLRLSSAISPALGLCGHILQHRWHAAAVKVQRNHLHYPEPTLAAAPISCM